MTASKKNDPKVEAEAKAKAEAEAKAKAEAEAKAKAATSIAAGIDTRGRVGLVVRTKPQGGKPLRALVRGGQKFGPDARFVDEAHITPAQRAAIEADPCLEWESVAG